MSSKTLLPFSRPHEYIVVWPGDEPIDIVAGGQYVRVPSRNDCSWKPGTRPEDRGPYRFPAAVDSSGEPIPGTIVLSDAFGSTPGGAVEKKFDAVGFLQAFQSTAFGAAVLARGMTVVESSGDVEAAIAANRAAWEEAAVAGWEQTLRDELDRQAKYKEKGHPAPPPTEREGLNIKAAMAGLAALRTRRAARGFSESELKAALSGEEAPVTPGDPLVELAKSASDIFQQAIAMNLPLRKDEMEGLLRRDLRTMESVKLRIESANDSVV